MPASEKTFYNMKRLHVVFAISSLALLAVTVWMFVADHRREWKDYQRTFRDRVEPWFTEARIRSERTDAFLAKETQLSKALETAQQGVPEKALVDRFCDELSQDAKRRAETSPDLVPIQEAYTALADAPTKETREAFLEQLREPLAAARFRRERLQQRLRIRRAELDEARSTYEVGVGEDLPPERLAELQASVDAIRADVDELDAQLDAAAAHAESLDRLLGSMTAAEDAARKALAQHRSQLEQLYRALDEESPNLAKKILRWPVIDALGGPLKVQQIWLPELTLDYNFRRVARYDRCTTCHLGADQVEPGSPPKPAYRSQATLTVELPTPEEAAGAGQGGSDQSGEASLSKRYGFALAERGILDPSTPTVGLVMPRTPAAVAQLEVGDAIVAIDEEPMADPAAVRAALLDAATWGKPRRLEIRRGLPNPYCSHPRLDLYVTSSSPHPANRFGCTICHDGQGTATEFKWASHTPNTPAERGQWTDRYGWFDNPHWDLRMRPARFAQSGCLQCHHDVTDLESSEPFQEPPAPKLLAGYDTIRQYGCFGCHEIRGVTEEGRRTGPDMRLEPPYHEAASQLLHVLGLERRELKPGEASLAESLRQVVANPADDAARQQAVKALEDQGAGASGIPQAAELVGLLANRTESPGTLRKVGPTLRHVADRMDLRMLADRIRDSSHFRPDSKMPRFFDMHGHLDGRALADGQRFEAVEVRAIAEYLLAASQHVEPAAVPPGVTESPSAERGATRFHFQGCLACHRHKDFPQYTSTFGPELSNFGSKITTEAGRQWLVSWLRGPHRHDPRTLMPDPLLKPAPTPAEGNGDGQDGADASVSDPAADIAAFLLESVDQQWQPLELPPLVESDLDELALMYLAKGYPRSEAERYLAKGLPESEAKQVRGDALELAGMTPENRLQKKLRYVGRATIRKRGCFGCHDIPGFETAQPIGPTLSDWGRKQESLLAFEQVRQLPGLFNEKDANDPDLGFYLDALRAGHREGFIWQKLRAPRSFDYKKAQNKGYNERLLMGKFPFQQNEIEQVATFVLGLVNDPPAASYIPAYDSRRQAVIDGGKIITKYGCAQCHTLQLERWKLEFNAEAFEEENREAPEFEDFEFLRPEITDRQVEDTARENRRGLRHAVLSGMPRMDAETGEPQIEDEDDQGNSLLLFIPWEATAINGWAWTEIGRDVAVWSQWITAKCPPAGGDFARRLYPEVFAEFGKPGDEDPAWGWVPPPLVGEGRKVRPDWLHDYLLAPFSIRPALEYQCGDFPAVLRMPSYGLSSAEAGKLVDYFAAVDAAEFPYPSDPRSRPLIEPAPDRVEAMEKAWQLIVRRKVDCLSCHRVGDYTPGEDTKTTLAPRLDRAGQRLRPGYLRRWVANPQRILPYNRMTRNFRPDQAPLGQDVFPGTAIEQLDGAVDLLLHYGWYMQGRTSVRQQAEAAQSQE